MLGVILSDDNYNDCCYVVKKINKMHCVSNGTKSLSDIWHLLYLHYMPYDAQEPQKKHIESIIYARKFSVSFTFIFKTNVKSLI